MIKIPLFPLNVVLFPGMPLDLHIFEPRYRIMVRECIEQKRPFGVALIRQGQEVQGPAVPYSVGCTARIASVKRLPDGRLNLTVMGKNRFRIRSLDDTKAYLSAEVEAYPLENPYRLIVFAGMIDLHLQVILYLQRLSAIIRDELDVSQLKLPGEVPGMLYAAAGLLQIPQVEKQRVLEAHNASDLMLLMRRLYRREIALLSPRVQVEEEQAKRSAELN